MSTALGFDDASVDGNDAPNYKALQRVGVTFAYKRVTFGMSRDSAFQRDWQAMADNGIVRGAYIMPSMKKGADPEAQIAFAASAITAAGGLVKGKDLPVALDVEFPKGIAATGMTRLECLDWIDKAVQSMVTNFGHLPMIYTSARVWDGQDDDSLDASRVPMPDLTDCPLWLARYPYKYKLPAHYLPEERDGLATPAVPRELGDQSDVWIHQYQGDSQGLPGIVRTTGVGAGKVTRPGQCDLNRFFYLSRATDPDGSERVKWLRKKLRIATDTSGGRWDDELERALREFQSIRALGGDGIVGPVTFAALAWENPPASARQP